MATVVVDASLLLKAYFRDERGHAGAQEFMKSYARGDYDLIAPSLLAYEINNACSIAYRKGRVNLDLAREILEEMSSLEILKKDINHLGRRIFDIACQLGQSSYDASYIALAEAEQCTLFTGDEKLYRAVTKHFPFMKLL
jgi:predicted nucleic acid-binding protein